MDDRHGPHRLGDDERLDEAWDFVIEHQGDQVRKGTDILYTEHLRGAAELVAGDGGTTDEVVAALLHDVVEDTDDVTVETVRARFGQQVAEIVDRCTDAAPTSEEGKEPWRARKEAHFAHLGGAGPGALRVVAADKTDNLRSQIRDLQACGGDEGQVADSLARFKGGFAGTLWYYRNVQAAMGDQLVGSALYDGFADLIEEFASQREPTAQEVECRDRVRTVLDRLDPSGVGGAAVDGGYYAIDADELARRATAPGAGSADRIVEALMDKWYGEDAWDEAIRGEIAAALRY